MLTCFILPQLLDADDVGLQVGLRWLHVDVVTHAVCAVVKAEALAVGALRACWVIHLLRFCQFNTHPAMTTSSPLPK